MSSSTASGDKTDGIRPLTYVPDLNPPLPLKGLFEPETPLSAFYVPAVVDDYLVFGFFNKPLLFGDYGVWLAL